MTIFAALALLLAVGCAETTDGTAGSGGVGGTGGTPLRRPAQVAQTCRDWCANEPEGLSCDQGPSGSVQDCYEDCLRDYQNQVERQYGDEWIAIKDCQVDLECEDLIGDCDSIEHDPYVQRARNREYCEANCPSFDIAQCEIDITECRRFVRANDYCESNCPTQDRQECVDLYDYLSTGSCGSGGAGGSGGTGGSGVI